MKWNSGQMLLRMSVVLLFLLLIMPGGVREVFLILLLFLSGGRGVLHILSQHVSGDVLLNPDPSVSEYSTCILNCVAKTIVPVRVCSSSHYRVVQWCLLIEGYFHIWTPIELALLMLFFSLQEIPMDEGHSHCRM